MNKIFEKLISVSFYLLAFLVPLVFYPHTSEVFEFNKIVTVYTLTVVILFSWIGKMIVEEKLFFRRTILDIPFLVFLGSQGISTILSIDFRTSLLGYYSRFNGGLVSTLCYILLYWAFVSNMDKRKILYMVFSLLLSAVIISFYGILEHFGMSISCLFVTGKLDVACWVQDVQNRVFATIGQPNWLAAWIVAITPLTWALSQNSKFKTLNSKLQFKAQNLFWYFLSSLFFLVLLYTKSRSGIIGFGVAFLTFWGLSFLKSKKLILKPFIIYASLFITLALVAGTPWTPSLGKLSTTSYLPPAQEIGPALEIGGSESGEIRKIVWKGAVDLWKRYPIFGSGVETFAFSYYETRPLEHNLVSEWDYLYNKAHNEYLNYAATSGSVGLISYLTLIAFTIFQFSKLKSLNSKVKTSIQNSKAENKLQYLGYSFKFNDLRFALFAGYASTLATNFFGFSVVPVSLLFFLFPAFAVTLDVSENKSETNSKLSVLQKSGIFVLLFIAFYLLLFTYRYWRADTLYKKGKQFNDSGLFVDGRKTLVQSTKLSPGEAVYLNEQAKSIGNLAVIYEESGRTEEATQALELYILEAEEAMKLSPRNLNIRRDVASMYTKLSVIDQNSLLKTNTLLLEMAKLAPTDPKIKLNLATSYIRLGQNQIAEEVLIQIIKEKPNYKEARFTYSAMLADKGEKEKALNELNYILTEIDPKDDNIREFIKEIEKL